VFVAGIVWAAVPPRNSVAEKNSAALLTPDLVLINGKILTVDPKDSIAEAMTAVKEADIHQLTWDSYRQILDDGKLTIRVFALWHAGTTIVSR